MLKRCQKDTWNTYLKDSSYKCICQTLTTGTNIKRQWFHFCINENFKDGGNSTTDSIKVLHLKSNTHKQGDKSDNQRSSYENKNLDDTAQLNSYLFQLFFFKIIYIRNNRSIHRALDPSLFLLVHFFLREYFALSCSSKVKSSFLIISSACSIEVGGAKELLSPSTLIREFLIRSNEAVRDLESSHCSTFCWEKFYINVNKFQQVQRKHNHTRI